MTNKLQKFLVALSGLLFMAVVVLLIKIQEDKKKIEEIKDKKETDSFNLLKANQERISSEREATLKKAAKAPASDITEKTTTTTVVPGKVIQETAPVKSDKKTKTS
jgi:hypothetical protein